MASRHKELHNRVAEPKGASLPSWSCFGCLFDSHAQTQKSPASIRRRGLFYLLKKEKSDTQQTYGDVFYRDSSSHRCKLLSRGILGASAMIQLRYQLGTVSTLLPAPAFSASQRWNSLDFVPPLTALYCCQYGLPGSLRRLAFLNRFIETNNSAFA